MKYCSNWRKYKYGSVLLRLTTTLFQSTEMRAQEPKVFRYHRYCSAANTTKTKRTYTVYRYILRAKLTQTQTKEGQKHKYCKSNALLKQYALHEAEITRSRHPRYRPFQEQSDCHPQCPPHLQQVYWFVFEVAATLGGGTQGTHFPNII